MATRQRQVFPRDTVAHLWAHAGQDSARDASQSFYFTGPTLYSYGSHFVIGHVLDDECEMGFRRVLWNDSTYSNTTSKHQTIAWRALSQQQRDGRLHVPKLNQDSARAIDRALQARKLPEQACESLLAKVRELVASTAKMRHGSGPFVNALHDARRYQTTAVAFYTRAGRKYPLPLLPDANDDVPADKTARADWILTFARVLILADYRRAIDAASQYLRAGMESIDPTAHAYVNPRDGVYVTQSTYSAFQRAERECFKAQTAYTLLHAGKKSTAVTKFLRQLAPLLEASRVASECAALKQERAEFAQRVRSFWQEEARNRRNGTHGNWIVTRTDEQSMPAYMQRIGVPVNSVDWLTGLRMSALARAERVNRLAEDVKRDLHAGDDYYSNGNPSAGSFSDAAACYRRALRTFAGFTTASAQDDKHVRFHAHRLQNQISRARDRLVAIDARIAEQERQRIADWVAGVSNIKPSYHAGTFARIKGDVIETTRGAVVPVAHACRLARVFDRIVSAGGKSWPDGSGPMVGHYRVNVIGADGALVIGCHEFNPTEARRLRDLLQACPECASVTADEVAA